MRLPSFQPQYRRAGLFVLWTAFILFMTLSSAPAHSETLGWLDIVCKRLGLPEITPQKTFHVTSYAIWIWLLAGLFAKGYRLPISLIQLGLCVLLLALMSGSQEALQGLNPDRHPSLFDVAINIAGGVACLILRPALLLPSPGIGLDANIGPSRH